MTEYYLINAMKVRVDDATAICAAANTELAALKERYPDEFELQRFLMGRPGDAGSALVWLSSPIRLRYLFAGIEMQWLQERVLDPSTNEFRTHFPIFET